MIDCSRQVKRQNLFDPDLSGELFCRNGMQQNYSNYFEVKVLLQLFFKEKLNKKNLTKKINKRKNYHG